MTDTGPRTALEVTNARTRIVGTRDGVLADALVAVVRLVHAAREVAAAAWVRLSRVVTPIGWAVLLVAICAFLAGYLLGWSEAVVLGWALIAVLACGVLAVLGNSTSEVRVSMPTSRVVVGETAAGDVMVRNRSHRRMRSGSIELPVGLGLAEFAIPALPRDGTFSEVFLVPTVRRGIVQIGPLRSARGDSFGLVRREIVWESTATLFVHPRTIAIPSMSTGFVRDLEGNPTRDLTADDIAFHALREYAPGDEPRTIHWRSSAKTGSLMVRQFEETRRSHLMVALSLATADYADDDEFELAVSVAGSLGVRAVRDGRTVSVVSSERTPDFAKHVVVAMRRFSTVSPTRLLDDLSGIELAGAQLRLPELARVAADSAAGVSVAFMVCGSACGPAQLRNASAHFPVGVEVVAVVCDPGGVPSFRRVGELSVLSVGYLEDLQKSLARSRAA
ncbi:DUF58 domain-containing protein [Rathayibacter soli]|uniref:DUF58 domain-containing protein n=1 Tax=Rathayibacter soli TaxID=3144168 RepID=UPI0027E4C4E5|nr:DUF58 domain-containing protein [Glaciibacter superstes]